MILEHKKITSVTLSAFSLTICYGVMGPDAIILGFSMLSFSKPWGMAKKKKKKKEQTGVARGGSLEKMDLKLA